MEPKDPLLLKMIVEYCDRITSSINNHNNNFEIFNQDLEYQDFCAFRVIQIGEYINSLSNTFKNSHPEIPWRSIVGLRNILTHDYGKVSNEKFWATLKEDIPALRNFCIRQIS